MSAAVLDDQLVGLLRSAAEGGEESFGLLVERLHGRLRAMAHNARQPSDTLTTTGLLGETYIRIERTFTFHQKTLPYFLSAVKTAMRRILIERRLARERFKRGGQWRRAQIGLDELVQSHEEALGVDVMDLFDALDELEKKHPEWHVAVSCSYLLGLSSAEAGKIVGSEPTFRKRRALGIHWLKQRLASEI